MAMRKHNEKIKELQERIIEAQFGAGLGRELMREIARHWDKQKAQGRTAQSVAAELGLAEWQLEAINALGLGQKRGRRRRRRRGRSSGQTGLHLVVELIEQPLHLRVVGLPEELERFVAGGDSQRDQTNNREEQQTSGDHEQGGKR